MSFVLYPTRSHRVASVLDIPSRRGERGPVLALCLAILAALPAGSSTIRFGAMAEVTASNAAANHQFGWAVAVDGDTLVVGAVNAYGSDWFTGAAYVFARNQTGADAWAEVVKLVGSDTVMSDLFGHSVAISGDLLVVGAPWSDPAGTSSGAAYVFERNQGGADAWGQVAKLTAADGMEADNFGTSVAIDGATVVVGAKYHTGPAYRSGAAYVFARNQGGPDAWGQVTKLTASDASSDNAFGHAVAISGSGVAVAANQDKSVYLFARNQGGADAWGEVRILTQGLGSTRGFGSALALDVDTLAIGGHSSIDSGAVWIHARNQGGVDNWGEVRQITASDAATEDFFGAAVALSGDRLLVGASRNDAAAADAGALFLFDRNAGGAENWGEVQRIVAADAAGTNYFGEAVDLDGSTAVAGAYGSDDFGGDSGSAYLFAACKADPGVWPPGLEVHASDGAASDYFGTAVAASGDTLVVGASDDDDLGASSGAAYVLVRNQGGADAWGEVVKLAAADGSTDDRFGVAVGVSGETAVVGANTESSAGLNAGAAYVFARNLGGSDAWGQITKLTASDRASYSFFGQAVAISGNFVLVGAPQASVGGVLKGAAYLFVRNLGGADAWGEATRQLAVDGAAGDFFGVSVALVGDTAIVGAKSDADAGSSSGSAYVFSRNQGGGNAWGQVAKLTATDAGTGHEFGTRVALIEGTALVGAPRASANLGAAYLYDRNLGGADAWGEVAKLDPTGGAAWEYFGRAIALTADAAFVAAPYDSDIASAAGSVSLFHRGCILRDFGDAPDPSYPTLAASGGARHELGSALHLGAAVDGELDGQPLPGAGGDDGSDVDDGDGVALPAEMLAGAGAGVAVTASASGLLNAWIDFDADGDWLDPGEQVITDVALAAGANPLEIPVPLAATPGSTFARFRFDSGGGLAPTGSAADGEVEDYLVTIVVPPDLAVSLADSRDPVPEGGTLHYLVTVTNDGPGDATVVSLTVTLPPEVAFVAATPGAPQCTEAAHVVTCDLGTRPAGSSTAVDIQVDVLPDTAGSVIHASAQVTLAETDLAPANNSDTEETTVIARVIFTDGFESGDTSMWSLTVGGG